jgi:Ser/Thr protein kinase RdoA (MazF antagonist)
VVPAVHEYLRHLASAGFEGSPRVLATGDGWEELTYIEGEVAFDPDWQPGRGNRLPPQARTDRALAGAGRLLRALHEAAAGFEPAVTTYRFHPHPPLPGEVVSHGDLGPWNTVYRDGVPVAFIDWDGAEPVEPVADLAAAAWRSCRSHPLPSWLRLASTQCPTCPNDSGFSWTRTG